MRYCPRSSETVVRTRINAGLVASTVTPGNTAPCASRIVPAIVPSWANAVVGISRRHAARAYLTLLDCSIEPPRHAMDVETRDRHDRYQRYRPTIGHAGATYTP